MLIRQFCLYLSTLFLWTIQNSRCRTEGFCDSRVSVVKVCNKDSAVSQRNVHIDTVSVPRFATTTCKCVISSSRIYEKFQFIYTGSTDRTGFKLNEHYLDKLDIEDIDDKADLFYTTNDSSTANGCLNVYTVKGTKFNITCFPSTTNTTTYPIRPRTSSSSTGITSVTEAVVEADRNKNGTNLNITYFPNSVTRATTYPIRPRTSSSSTGIASVAEAVVEADRNSEYETDIIRNETNFNITYSPNSTTLTTDPAKPSASHSDTGITKVTESEVKADRNSKHETHILGPVVTTVSVVCIAGVIALVVVCRRRYLADKQKSETSTAVEVEEEKEDEYYMTEGPMYDAIDVEPNVPSGESEYHYINVDKEKEDEYYMTEDPMYDATDVEPNVPSGESESHYINVDKEKEDEYYMTEDPMYDATDVEPNVPSAESESHYIEAENQDGSMPDCQYESIPDFL